ncbi:MAG: ribonuclease HI [Synechococcus sp.]
MVEGHGRVVAVATDGACSGNPGPGGWGALLRYEDGSVEEFGGFDPATTNNRMELQAALAVLERLQQLPRHPDLRLRTDSKYLIDGLGSWMKGWKRKGWKTAAGKPVLNQDLWQALDQARLDDVPLAYVKGHSGDPDNERVDQIAVAFSRGQQPVPLQSGEVTAGERTGAYKRVASGATPNAPVVEVISQPADKHDPAPPALQRLLTRLELADRLARGGYGLTAMELAQLVEQPLSKLGRHQRAWRWRDWEVQPIDGGSRWRLHRDAAGSKQNDEAGDG